VNLSKVQFPFSIHFPEYFILCLSFIHISVSSHCLYSIPGDLKYKDAAAMLEVQTREAGAGRIAYSSRFCIVLRPQGNRKQWKTLRKRSSVAGA